MRRLLIALLFIDAASATAVAEDKAKATQDTPEFRALQKEYEAATKRYLEEYEKEYESAMKEGKEKHFKPSKPSPVPDFSKRFLAMAEKDPEGPSGLNAMRMSLNSCGGPKGEAGTWPGVIKLLRKHYATKPGLKPVLRFVAQYVDEDGDAFVRDAIAKNPDRKTQADAYRALINARENAVELAKALKEKEDIRKRFEQFESKEEIAKRIADAEKFEKEAAELSKILHRQYGDLVTDLSVGRPMPELASEGLDGKTQRLSELKGKVVVLDIWTTWCGPCRAMIPHEREMVERLKGKPFQLVSISADEKKVTLTDFLAKEKMPWMHWWNGAEGKLLDTLSIEHYPTIFVLDAQGVIRYKEIRGEELEKAVNELLKESEAKKTAAN